MEAERKHMKNMKQWITIIVILGMVGWAVFSFMSNSNKTADSDTAEAEEEFGINQGDLAPDFNLTTLDGKTVKLSDYRGKPVMLNFWATWCPPCRSEMPDMEKFHQDTDIVILAVNLTSQESNLQSVHDFIDELGLTFTIPLDETNEVATNYQIQPIPTTFMIDKTGKIHHKQFGPMNYDFMVQQFNEMK